MDQHEYALEVKKWDIVNSAIQTSLKMGALVAIVWIGGRALEVIAGKQTILSVALSVVANLKISEKIAYLLAVSASIYGYRQKRLRQTVIEKMSSHSHQLEKIIDPQRKGSEITPKGTTRPDDKSLG